MNKAPFQPHIKKHGQPYYDEPVYVLPRPLNAAVLQAFGRTLPKIMIAYDRVPLIWKNKHASK